MKITLDDCKNFVEQAQFKEISDLLDAIQIRMGIKKPETKPPPPSKPKRSTSHLQLIQGGKK